MTLYTICRRLLLIGCVALWSVLALSAQSAADFTVKAVATKSTCLQNGSVTINVTKKAGTPTNYTYKTYYNLLNSKGQSVTATLGFVETNVISNLYADTYTAQVIIEIQESGLRINLPDVKATVTSTYVSPSVQVSLIRKPLKNYIPEGSTTPQPTGIISVKVQGGLAPYTLEILETPEGYKETKREYALTKGTELKLYNVAAGTYRFQVSDGCNDTPIQTLEVPYVSSDLPESNQNDMPAEIYLRQTEEMKESHCGWVRLGYQYTKTSARTADLINYFSNKDTLARYYDYAWQVPNDTNAGKPKEYHPMFTMGTAPFGDTNYGSDASAWYYKLPDGVSYAQAYSNKNQYQPNLFLKVKGSSEEMPQGYRGTEDMGNLSEIENTLIGNQCDTIYRLGVRPCYNASGYQKKLLCLPIVCTLVSQSDPTDRQELILTEMSPDYKLFEKALDRNETYTLTSVAGDGTTRVVTLGGVPKVSFGVTTYTDNDYCAGKYGVSLAVRITSGGSLEGWKVRLVSVPEGYKPLDGGLQVGEEYTITASDINSSGYLFYTSPKGNMKTVVYNYEMNLTGQIKYELIDPCGVVYPRSTSRTEQPAPKLSGDPSVLKPRVVKEECGRTRVYPFAGGYEGLLTQDGEPIQPYLFISKFPSGVTINDVRSNIPVSDVAWNTRKIFTFQYTGLKPEEIYLDFPSMNGSITLKVIRTGNQVATDAKNNLSCLPSINVSIDNPPLSYDRDLYIGFACPSATSGLLHVVPVNCVGDATVDVYNVETGKQVYHFEQVDKTAGVSIFLVGTHDDLIPTNYRLVITDGLCQNSVDEIIPIYNLSSSSIIQTKEQQFKYCEGDPIEMDVINLGQVGYTWTLPNGEERSGRKLVIDQAKPEHSGLYTLTLSQVECGGVVTPIQVSVLLSVAPRELWWRQDATDQNWNNPNNWAHADGSPVSAVPASCTVVHIPGSVDKAYPDLSATATDRTTFGEPVCSDIYFHYGAQLGDPQRLTYERAFIDYNFGEMTSGTITAHQPQGHPEADSKLLERDRWYMLSAPLNNMMSGDFSLSGYPKSYQRYVLTKQSSEAVTDVSFTQPFASMIETFAPTTYRYALALKVAGWESGRKGYDDHKYLNKLEGIIRIPFFADGSRADAYPLHSYDATSGYSTFRYYNEETMAPLAYTERGSRGSGLYPYRFVYETYNTTTPELSAIGTISNTSNAGELIQGYALTLSGVAKDEYFMVGNPFMTSIDFDKLWAFNKDLIYPYYYVFEDTQWRMYSAETPDVSTRGKAIAPLQAILLRRKATTTSALNFPTTGSNSVLLPAWTIVDATTPVVAQSAHEMDRGATAILPIRLYDALDGDQILASSYLYWDCQGDNIPALSNSEYTEAPLLYLVDRVTHEGVQVLYPESGVGRLDLGVRASYASEMVLDFSDMDRTLYEYMRLVDRKQGYEQDLLREPRYHFVYELDGVDPRFELQLKRYGVPLSSDSMADALEVPEVSIRTLDEECLVEANQPIRSVDLYDLSGQQLYSYQSDRATQTHTISVRALPETIIIKVLLESGYLDVQKVQLTY